MAANTTTVIGGDFTNTDTFTTTGTGTVMNLVGNPMGSFAMQVSGTGAAATAWSVNLEGSLDNANWTPIFTHSTTTGDKVILYSSTPTPSLYVRANCTLLTLGTATNIVVTTLGLV